MTERTQQSEAIYDAYPRKAAMPRALKAIERALVTNSYPKLLHAAEEMRRLWKPCDEENRKMFPHPASFFNQGRWDDLEDFRLQFPAAKPTVMPGISERPAAASYFWRCAKCGYALVGRPEFRCAGCGTPFDREYIEDVDARSR